MTDDAKSPPAMKTKTEPESRREGFFEGPDPVTSIHVLGTVHHFELPKQVKMITLGSAASCDVVVPSPYMSRHHLTIERRFEGIRIHDHSKNGTYIEAKRIREDHDIRAGHTFNAGGVTFLALDEAMQRVYPVLSDLIDWELDSSFEPARSRFPTPYDAIRLSAVLDPIMISGDVGCDQVRLARAIHAMSAMRDREIVYVDSIPADRGEQKELLLRAQRTTMILTIGDDMPVMDEAFRSSLFSTSYRIRIIVLAWPRRARAVLGEDYANMVSLALRPLAYRGPEQLQRLLDRQLEARDCPLRFAGLTGVNRNALLHCEWRRNFDDLRIAADRFTALTRAGSLRKAAGVLGESFSTLQHWFTNMLGLELPLGDERS